MALVARMTNPAALDRAVREVIAAIKNPFNWPPVGWTHFMGEPTDGTATGAIRARYRQIVAETQQASARK